MLNIPPINPQWLHLAETAARAAGRIAVDYRGRVETRSKGPRDLVTEADVLCQAEIKRMIGEAFPDHAFLAEEADTNPGGGSELCWVIDPIDGTSNYSYGVPVFCTSIALTYQGQSLVGVVYDPLRDDLYAGVLGQGATLNGIPMRVSQRSRMIDALIALEWASKPAMRTESIQRMAVLAEQCLTVRSPGAAALSLCLVAAGAVDVYFNVHLNPWDMAAAGLMIQEAGGQLSRINGEAWTIETGGVLATNGRLHGAVLDLWHRLQET